MHTLPDRRRRSPLLAFLAALALLAAAAPSAPAAGRPDALLRALNAARAEHGVPPVRADRRLARAARAHSLEMVKRRYFAHESPGGERPSERIARTGWMRARRHWWVGEDLAWGIARAGRPSSIVAAWLASPPHRHVLLRRRYRAVGIGVARGTPSGRRGWTYTADFGG